MFHCAPRLLRSQLLALNPRCGQALFILACWLSPYLIRRTQTITAVSRYTCKHQKVKTWKKNHFRVHETMAFVSLSFLKFLDALTVYLLKYKFERNYFFSYSLFFVLYLFRLINTILADPLADGLHYLHRRYVGSPQQYSWNIQIYIALTI